MTQAQQIARALSFTIPGDVVPWARAGGRGHLRFTPGKQRNYMAVVRQYASDAMGDAALMDGPLYLEVHATWPWPKTLSLKRRQIDGAAWKSTKPDAGNVAKLIEDALNLVVYSDDARICDLHVTKRFGDNPGVHVKVGART